MMNIGMFHATLPTPGRKLGGVEVFVQRMADHLVLQGHPCTVYSLNGEILPGSRFEHVRLFPALSRLLGSKAARWTLLPFLLNFAPFRRHDVLVLHGDDWFYFLRRNPTFRLFHGAALFESRSATSRKRRLVQGLIHHGERLAARLATARGSVGTDSAKLLGCEHVVDCGIDPTLHHPRPKTSHPSILFVGTLHGRKQGSLALEIFQNAILPVHPEATLDFVADKPPVSAIPGVRFVPFPSDQELAEIYGRSWIFLYPSLYEGFGIPYLEALASGCAVACLANEGSTRLLTGCPAADVRNDREGLVRSCLERIAQGPATYQSPAVAWAQRYAWPRVVDRWVEIFQSLRH